MLPIFVNPPHPRSLHSTGHGEGIPPENLTRIFVHGFTTHADGHGFGLHSSALAAKEMDGAVFTLEVPLERQLVTA